MNLIKAIQLVFSRRKRVEYNAWEQWAIESRAVSVEDDLDLDNSPVFFADENLNEEWIKFNGGAK